jgi:dolichol-phosphate mannosyltransferase
MDTIDSGVGLLIVANFNQAKEIQNFLTGSETYFPKKHTIVVDDGSNDGSPEMAESLGFTVIRHGKNLGIGAAIRSGLHYALKNKYRWVMISSSNGKCRPEDYANVYGPVLRGEADYTTGNRFLKGGGTPGLPAFRRMTIPIFSAFASIILRRRFADITCGFRAYTLDLLKLPTVNIDQPWLERYELEYYLHYRAVRAPNIRIVEVPITSRYSHIAPGRTSKIRPFIDWWSMIRPFFLLSLGLRK